MRSLFHDTAFIEHDDTISMFHRREPMSDDKCGATGHEPFERLLHQGLGLIVERTGGFIEDENGRVLEKGPGDCHPLSLAATQFHATLTNAGLVPTRQGGDEVMSIGRSGRGLDFHQGGVEPGIGEVLANRTTKEHRLLWNHGDGGP
jgi:hypothetical protein